MANVQYYDVILKPVVTEKSMNAMAEKKYTFLVHILCPLQTFIQNLRKSFVRQYDINPHGFIYPLMIV